MRHKYNVTVFLSNGEGEAMKLDGTIEFDKNENDYGNGYWMFVCGLGEPFGEQGYDIRYDHEFSKNETLLYVVKFYFNKFKGNRRWNMTESWYKKLNKHNAVPGRLIPGRKESHMRIIKMSNAFCDYEEIVEGFSTQTTKAEMKESLREMAKNKELETWEFCLLYKIATDRINGIK